MTINVWKVIVFSGKMKQFSSDEIKRKADTNMNEELISPGGILPPHSRLSILFGTPCIYRLARFQCISVTDWEKSSISIDVTKREMNEPHEMESLNRLNDF